MIILLFFTSCRRSLLASSLKATTRSKQRRRRSASQLPHAPRPSNRVCTFHVGKPEAIVCSSGKTRTTQKISRPRWRNDCHFLWPFSFHNMPRWQKAAIQCSASFDMFWPSMPVCLYSISTRCLGWEAVVHDRVKVRSSVRIFHLQTS